MHIVGYTAGAFDIFHIGHLNLLRNAKGLCDKLVVGVSTDELILTKKGHLPVVPYDERVAIISSVKYVDAVIAQTNLEDKIKICRELGATYLFSGDDWFGDSRWAEYERDFATCGGKIIYFPYTQSTSSTLLTKFLKERV